MEKSNVRVEKHVLKKGNTFFDMLQGYCHKSKNLYNHADLNGAYQIMRKVISVKWDRGCVLHPVVVNLG